MLTKENDNEHSCKKIELIEWLTKEEELKKQAIREAYEDQLKPMTAEKYKAMLDQSEAEYQKGSITSQQDLEKESDGISL